MTTFNRAWITGSGHAPAIGIFQVTYQLCLHDHPSRDEALRCASGGDYLHERETDRLVELRPWERVNGEALTLEQAQAAVNEAMISVDPRLAEPTSRSQALAQVAQRGKRINVTIYHGRALFKQFDKAIRDALGPAVDLVEAERD